MPCLLRQARPRESGRLPIFQSEVAPESITHCNTHTHTENTQLQLSASANQDPTVPGEPHAAWARHASSCRPGRGRLAGCQSHMWRWLRCLSSTKHTHIHTHTNTAGENTVTAQTITTHYSQHSAEVRGFTAASLCVWMWIEVGGASTGQL